MTIITDKTSFERAVAHSHNIEAIATFIPPGKEMAALPVVCKAFRDHFFQKQHSPIQFEQSRYPFHVYDSSTLEDLKNKFEFLRRNPFYLRELMPNGMTPAWEAFKLAKDDIAAYFLEHGGLLAVTGAQKEELRNYPTLFVGMPAISTQIRNERWVAAVSQEKQKVMLQAALKEYCLKSRLEEMQWIFRKAKKHGIVLSPLKPLENAIRGGFEDIITELFKEMDCNGLSDKEKLDLVNLSVEMGYHHLLSLLKKYGFPISIVHARKLEELQFVQKGLARYITFPRPASINTHTVHGGDANLTTSEEEYVQMVGYAFNALRSGMHIRTLIENLQHRRRRSAVRCNLIKDIDYYGAPTKMTILTDFNPSYQEYGKRIKSKYSRFPVQVTAQFGSLVVRMTKIFETHWEHPDGSYRGRILDEVVRICSPLRKGFCKDLGTPLSQSIFLISHYPPCERGTPLVLRALVDALCLFQHRDPIDSTYEFNCDALVFDKQSEFAESFQKRAPLLISPKNDDVFSMKGCLQPSNGGTQECDSSADRKEEFQELGELQNSITKCYKK